MTSSSSHFLRYDTLLKKMSSFGIFWLYLFCSYVRHWWKSRVLCIFLKKNHSCNIIVQQIRWNIDPQTVDGRVWVGLDNWMLMEEKTHTRHNGCHSIHETSFCFFGQHSHIRCDYPTSYPPISDTHFPLTALSLDDCFKQSCQKRAYLSFHHHKPTSTDIWYRERSVSLPYLRLNLSAILDISSPLPLPEVHNLLALQTPTLLSSIST